MVRRFSALGLALATLLLASPSLASANRLKLKSYHLEPTEFVIELEGTEALSQPWIRVAGSTAKIWFSEIDTLSRFEQGEAGAPIESLTLRPSKMKTGLLRLDLQPGHVITQRDVEITRKGTGATIRVALPAAMPAKPAAASAVAQASAPIAAAAVAAPAADVTPKPAATLPVQVQVQSAPVQAVPASPEPGFKGAEDAATAQPAAKLPSALQKKAEPKLLEPTSQLSTVQILFMLTIVLGAIYGLIRIKMRKRSTEFAPTEIQVLGNKRLGARHQLVIVRALGQDHLISVNGGRTERIASSDVLLALPATGSGSPKAGAGSASGQPKSPGRLGLGLSSALRAMRGHEMFAGAEGQQTAAPAPSSETPFGAELLDFVRTGGTRNNNSNNNARLSESEAIAGLVRLRNRSS